MSTPSVRSLKPNNEGQLTLSSNACEKLGVDKGASVIEVVTGSCVFLFPENPVLSDAVKGASEALARAGVTVEELLAEVERLKEERVAREYPDLAS